MAAAAVSAPRYSSEDFDTASIHSAAPSYVSDAPSYQTMPRTNNETRLAYTPAPSASNASTSLSQNFDSAPREQTQNFGLPPVPPLTPRSPMGLYHFRVPTWSASGPTARHYRNVAERRMADGRYSRFSEPNKSKPTPRESQVIEQMDQIPEVSRPLEDPVLVGEVAAAQARRDRIARETGEDILIREDQQWDWLLGQMKTWDERERSWSRLHRDVGATQNRRLLGRMGQPRTF